MSLSSREKRGSRRRLLVGAVALGLGLICPTALDALAGSAARSLTENVVPPLPTEAFRPSNARTIDGKLIPSEQFFPSTRCAGCHKDTHAAWSESLHRNAAREPFYRESADILLRSRGIEYTRHCEACHTPVALFAGALTTGSTEPRDSDDEGITCTVCHSIVDATVDGTGSYTIRRPALLMRPDGTPVFGDMPDKTILDNVPDHKRAMMRPVLRSPEFCATCHKVTLPEDLNGYKPLVGFSAYDDWQKSGASHESITSFKRRPERVDCRGCHMPKVESLNDRAAKNKVIASHRWLGANTAAPTFYGQHEQVERTKAFLSNDVVGVDVFAARGDAKGLFVGPLTQATENGVGFAPGDEITVDVVVANRNAAHTFPPEVRDLYEAWVEFEAVDEAGRTVFQSGYLKPDGMLDERAHVYKSILLDATGRPITRHQVWLTTIKAYDNTIAPGQADVARYRFRVPDGVAALELRARVKYRRFNQEYTNYVLARRSATLVLPVVTMAESSTVIRGGGADAQGAASDGAAARWNDYGIGLLAQSQSSAAADAFRRAFEADPTKADYLINAAIAELRTERWGWERTQQRKAGDLLDRALAVDPASVRARFYRATVMRAEGRVLEAANEMAAVAREYPRDREVQRQLGQTLATLGRRAEAIEAFEAIAKVDPTDWGAYQFLASLYASEGRSEDAARAQALYRAWRDDPKADVVAMRFYAAHPQWADERTSTHAHGKAAPRRPVLTGAKAAPVE